MAPCDLCSNPAWQVALGSLDQTDDRRNFHHRVGKRSSSRSRPSTEQPSGGGGGSSERRLPASAPECSNFSKSVPTPQGGSSGRRGGAASSSNVNSRRCLSSKPRLADCACRLERRASREWVSPTSDSKTPDRQQRRLEPPESERGLKR